MMHSVSLKKWRQLAVMGIRFVLERLILFHYFHDNHQDSTWLICCYLSFLNNKNIYSIDPSWEAHHEATWQTLSSKLTFQFVGQPLCFC
jgi:hypothetical protein